MLFAFCVVWFVFFFVFVLVCLACCCWFNFGLTFRAWVPNYGTCLCTHKTIVTMSAAMDLKKWHTKQGVVRKKILPDVRDDPMGDPTCDLFESSTGRDYMLKEHT